MRKVYVVIGFNPKDNDKWINGIFSSRKKAERRVELMRTSKKHIYYYLTTEIIV